MNKVPLYFSSNLEFSIKNKKGFCTDRIKLKSVLPNVFFGCLLVALGVYEWLNGFKFSEGEFPPAFQAPLYKPLIATWFFDLCFIIIGLAVVSSNICSFLRYNKYRIDGSKITIIHRRLFHGKKIAVEDVKNYVGVRFRVEFLQVGLLTKNRYIVELYHKNADKTVPLYLSTDEYNVRRMWKEYAKKFRLPAVIFTDEGVKFIDSKSLNKSISTQYKQGLIEDNYDEYERLPKIFAYVRKKDKIVIKIKKIIWDAYNIIAWFFVGTLGVVLVAAAGTVLSSNQACCTGINLLMGICLGLIIIMIQILFRKEKLVIKRNKIVHTHKYMLFSTKHNQMMKKDIESVEITQNPATGRCYVSIISDDNTIAFGAKIAVKDLRWVKKFLIHEIVN